MAALLAICTSIVSRRVRVFSVQLQESLDQVEQQLKRHEAFEQASAAQEQRFAALQKLTTVRCALPLALALVLHLPLLLSRAQFEIRARQRTPEDEERKRHELDTRKRRVLREFRTPSQPSAAASGSLSSHGRPSVSVSAKGSYASPMPCSLRSHLPLGRRSIQLAQFD